MVDDVLRMRATLVSDETLANLRAIGREIGLMPQKAKPHIAEVNTGFAKLTETMKSFGEQTLKAVPALEEWGLGAAGAGAAAGVLMNTLTNMSKRIVELKYRSIELGMSERDIRAWVSTAEKAGVSAQSMMAGLGGFKNVTEGLRYNIGGVRDQLYSLGAGPVVRAMQAASSQGEKLKIAFAFKEVLWKESPWKAEQFFESIGLGAAAARLHLEEYERTQAKLAERSPEDQEKAKKFADALVDLGEAWEHLSTKLGVALFPGLTQAITGVERLLTLSPELNPFSKENIERQRQQQEILKKDLPAIPPPPTIQELNRRQQERRGGARPLGLLGGDSRYSDYLADVVPSQNIEDRRGEGGSRVIQVGVFDALVQFQGYAGAGGLGGGGAGGGALGVLGSPSDRLGGGGAGGGALGVLGGPSGGLGGGGAGGGALGVLGGPSGGLGGGGGGGGGASGGGAGGGSGAGGGGVPPGGGSGVPGAPGGGGLAEAVKRFEGFEPKAKWDFKQFTSGYGTKAGYKGEPITRQEAEKRLQLELGQAGAAVEKINPDLDAGTKAALTDLVFNAGPGALKGIRGAIASGDTAAIREWLPSHYTTAGGKPLTALIKRRAEEATWVGNKTFGQGHAVPETSGVPSHFAADLTAMTLAGAQPHNIHAYMMAHGINLSEATCGRFMASVVKEHGGTPPPNPAAASSWNEFGGRGGAGYSADPNAINIAVRQGTAVGASGSHVTGAIPIYDQSGRITGFRGVGVNQFNPQGAEHGIGQYGRDVISSQRLSIGTGRGQYQIRHEIPAEDIGAIDRHINGGQKVEGSVNIQVHSDGTAARTKANTNGGLFGKTTIRQHKQMAPTDAPAGNIQVA